MIESIWAWVILNWIELSAFVLGVIYVILATKENPWCWLFGIINVSVYVVIFLKARLYGDMFLQILYLLLGFYGWYKWQFDKSASEQNKAILKLKFKLFIYILLIVILLSAISIYILTFTDTDVPFADGIVTALGLVSTWLAAKKYLENWLFWIIANSLSVGIYIYKQLHITSVFYVVLTILAVVGYIQWKKSLQHATK